ncbi:hypothetical protein AHF37_11926 [Paragonimus kellicotti]|nr:hypothetical protein AHF37_11926 [Paragonimus kellicotti]
MEPPTLTPLAIDVTSSTTLEAIPSLQSQVSRDQLQGCQTCLVHLHTQLHRHTQRKTALRTNNKTSFLLTVHSR